MLDHALTNDLFPSDLPEVSHWEQYFAPRDLADGCRVTRFAPSPTGFLHIGGLYTAMVSESLADQTGGVFLLRIEDTDQARLVAGADRQFEKILEHYGLSPDEDRRNGAWGPYLQSERVDIYLSHIRDLMRRGLAYPCFCTKEELAARAEEQRATRSPIGYYGRWAPCRTMTTEETVRRLADGTPYVVRFRCPREIPGRVRFPDLIRGGVTMQDNGNDIVLLKSSDQDIDLPTYHLAHVVDDHLMRVTLVVRGDEWLSSVPVHLQLHKALGFKVPQYAHLAPLMKVDGTSRRKLSKRKDPESSVDFYLAAGYPPSAVVHYLRGLANSRISEMSTAKGLATPIAISEMGTAGPLLDLPKLRSISREFISQLSTDEFIREVRNWSAEHDPELDAVLERHPALAGKVVAMIQNRSGQPRKDIACWSEFREKYGFCFPELHVPPAALDDPRFNSLDPSLVARVADDFAAAYHHHDQPAPWFRQLRDLAGRYGFATDTRSMRQDGHRYPGSVRDLADVVRVCLTGATRSPDLFEVAHTIGHDEVLRRLAAFRPAVAVDHVG